MSHSKYAYANHSSILKKVRLLVLASAQGKCEICGDRARIVHHKDGSTVNHELDNLIALCVACHNAIHKEDTGGAPRKTQSKYTRLFGFNLNELSRMTGLSPWSIQARWLDDPEKKALLLRAVANPETAKFVIAFESASCPPSIRDNSRIKSIRHLQSAPRA
jgi:hypothetical protein